MSKRVIVWLIAMLTLPAFGAQTVTVQQLRERLASSRAESDDELASQLSDMQLTERLSSSQLVD